MKKLLIASSILFSGLVAGPSGFASAAVLDPIIWDGTNAMPNSLPAAVAGDTFTFTNSDGPIVMVVNATGGVKVGAQTCNPHDCDVDQMVTSTFEVVSPGTIQVQAANGTVLGTITLGSDEMQRRSPTRTVSFDPNGGVCDGKSKPWNEKFKNTFDLAGRFDCSKEGYRLVGWTRDPAKTSDNDLITTFVARSGTLTAVWRPIPEPPGTVMTVVNLFCGPCAKASLSWQPSATSGVTYEVDLTGPSGTTTYSTATLTLDVDNLTPGSTYVAKISSVKDGVRSDVGRSPGDTFTVSAAANPTIAIAGSRGSADESLPIGQTCASHVAGPPERALPTACVVVDGITTGLAAGTEVTPEYRFLGQTSYTIGIPIKVDSNGEFTWYRKTGKKIYVRFIVGDIVSNRVIIPAK